MRKVNADVKIFKAIFFSLVLAFLVYACAVVVHSEKVNPVKRRAVNLNFSNMSKTDELIKFEEVKGSPFTVAEVFNDELDTFEFYVLMGKYRMSEIPFKTKEEAIESVKEPTWDLIMKLIYIVNVHQENEVELLKDESNE